MAVKIEKLIEIARNAGKIVLRFYRQVTEYGAKMSEADIVTEADMESQKYIVESLNRCFPEIPVLAEEGLTSRNGERYFVVDPLDGTLNFFHGLPFFSISIAYVDEKGPCMGVVHAPATGETFFAVRGEGSYDHIGKRLHVSTTTELRQCLAVTGWPYDKLLQPWTQRTVNLFQELVQEVRILGSAALEMAYLAAGHIDLYWEVGLYPWDLAAGYLLVEEAGGRVSDVNGENFSLSTGRVAASNGILHEELIGNLMKCGELREEGRYEP